MNVLLISLLLALVVCSCAAESLPDKFYGTWDLDHSENFDEYLAAKGYGWLTRKLVTLAKFKKEFKRAPGGKFDYANLTSKKDVFYKGVTLGRKFIGEGLDGGKHEVLFEMKNGALHEHHHPLKGGVAKDETYMYTVQGPYLVLKMEANGVVGVRYYKRV